MLQCWRRKTNKLKMPLTGRDRRSRRDLLCRIYDGDDLGWCRMYYVEFMIVII